MTTKWTRLWPEWIRSLPGIWFIIYLPIAFLLVFYDDFSAREYIGFPASIILVNFLLLSRFRNVNGRENILTRPFFAFGSPIFAFIFTMIYKPIFEPIAIAKLAYFFQTIYAAGIFGYWLPCDNVQSQAQNYFDEYKTYLWPSLFITTTAIVVGSWKLDLSKLEYLWYLTYANIGFAASALLVFHYIERFRWQKMGIKS